MSILMACYLAVNGQLAWIEGRETAEVGPSKRNKFLSERVFFVPLDSSVRPRVVDSNDCKYLEDPVEAYQRQLDAKKTGARQGQGQWCRVTNAGDTLCQYDDWRPCMARVDKGEYCEPNRLSEEEALNAIGAR